MKDYSQSGEQKCLIDIFNIIGVKYNKCLEFGAGDGIKLSNTRYFINEGWTGILWDMNPRSDCVNNEIVTKDNINYLFVKYGLDTGLDLMSVDIDGNDYWVWKELKYYPRVVVIEYNNSLGTTESKTIEYNETHIWDETEYYGASLTALRKLGNEKGYTLVGVIGCNMIFVKDEEADKGFDELFRKQYININTDKGHKLDHLNRKWVLV